MSAENAVAVEDPTKKCTEHDVLMGRGKRVSEWPGNIFFRQCVNKHRNEYTSAVRNEKVEIATRVIQEIRDAGGRFLAESKTENNSSSWFEVDEARAIEKTCQALREKEKPKTSNKSPFVGEAVAEQMLQKHRIIDKRKLEKQQKAGSTTKNEDKRKPSIKKGRNKKKRRAANGSGEENESDSSDEYLSGEDGGGSSRRRKSSFPAPEAMLDRLRKFKSTNGHTAVPTGWKEDIVLADWCTAQRQLFREVETGYRAENKQGEHGKGDGKEEAKEAMCEVKNSSILTVEQQKLLDALREMEFCWDYEEWHWNRKFSKLVDQKKEVTQWLRYQKRQYREGELSENHAEKLKQAGVILL